MRIRKKPIEVEGQQLTEENFSAVAEWCDAFISIIDGEMSLSILTLDGSMKAYVGDWIIKGENNQFYICKNSIFKKTYDIITGEKVGDDKIMVDGIVEHEDGSATVTFDLSEEMVKTFAKIGLEAVLLESVENFSKEQKNEG